MGYQIAWISKTCWGNKFSSIY